MDRDTIIRLAREAEGEEQHHGMWRMHVEDLERFATLVADYLRSTDIHSCHAECQRPMCVAVRQAVAAEREQCARVAEKHWDNLGIGQRIAAAIRSRT